MTAQPETPTHATAGRHRLTRAPRTSLADGVLRDRRELNVAYLESLQPDNLLRPYRFEAGLWSWCGTAGTTVGATVADGPETWHWGWEAPTSQLRGHILGHWLSAVSYLRHDHPRLGAAADEVIAELARCQHANGDGWIAPFSEKYLYRIAAGKPVWAPQYVLHKLFAGLLDAATIGGDHQALQIVIDAAGWFDRWTVGFDRAQLDDLLDVETGGMLEVWANLYGLTGDPRHLSLLRRYRRGRLFDPLLAGVDVVTNKHANTQIAEILGAARAYEVTGEPEWRDIVEAFWACAVTDRGTYVTGGSSSGEIWQPPHQQAARLHDVQEHCTVVNLMRLADYLYRWTGEPRYAAYWEAGLINGVLAQQHPETGMVAYFLPLESGSTKTWGHPTRDFWCCHGSLLQAHSDYLGAAVHTVDDTDIRISQYQPSNNRLDLPGVGPVVVDIGPDVRGGVVPGLHHSLDGYHGIQHVHLSAAPPDRPSATVHRIRVAAATPATFTLELRIPDWAAGPPQVTINGFPVTCPDGEQLLRLRREWVYDLIEITVPTALACHPLPGQPDLVAFTDGPIVLAGLTDHDRVLRGDPRSPTTLLRPDRERHHSWWNAGYHRTVATDPGIRFMPLFEITDQTYTVYFPTAPTFPTGPT